ncbi:molybdopterin-guanine dinucleotide biosynthesis protein B [Vibrio sp. SS-MA-C1-2]|nr:molybdopterin-guanine dinucleotide biosynthesis protein B [Vibrio sp. SS-MA-C1-2]UJF20150.1 molybdopterin-guanine dinucleotide biosynthesis protein B [Vibrio sp. SS-MA-C1-2]
MKTIIGFAGYSGSGKTTLLEKLIPKLKANGIRIGLIKHSHHQIEPDKPGKDSYRLRHAGCDQTLLATKERHMLYFEYPESTRSEPSLNECLQQLDHSQLDLILVEGFRDQAIPKIEIHKQDCQRPKFYLNDNNVIAFVTQDIKNCQLPIPVFNRNNISEISQFILTFYHQNIHS